MLNTKTLQEFAPYLFVWLFMSNMIDAATTAQLIEWDGLDVEVNPFMRHIIEHYGTLGMALYKSFAVAFLGIMYKIVRDRAPEHMRLVLLGLVASCVVYTCLALHNTWAVYYVSSFQS